jgi:hypothetical protein
MPGCEKLSSRSKGFAVDLSEADGGELRVSQDRGQGEKTWQQGGGEGIKINP